MKKIVLFLSIFCLYLNIANAQIAVIANKSIKEKINLSALTSIFQLDQTELGGSKIVVFDLSEESGLKQAFYNALGKSNSEYKKIWMKKKLTGNGTPPKLVANEDEMLSKVASTPGAIGFISASKVNSSVNVILIIK